MVRTTPFRTAPALLVLAYALAGQTPVCVSGLLEPVPGPTICQQGETHWFAAARVYLRSNTVNLASFAGQVVQVEGPDIGLLCRVIDVRRVAAPAPALLVSCGSPMAGCPVRVEVQGPGLGFAILAASTGAGFQPLGCGGLGALEGTLLLGSPAVVLVAGTTGTGELGVTIPIPLQNALVGVGILFQGAHATIGPVGPLHLTNVERIVVSPLLPPCLPITC